MMDVTQDELFKMIGVREVQIMALKRDLAAVKAELVLVREEVARLQQEIGRDYGEPA